jgi:hypothetical protein
MGGHVPTTETNKQTLYICNGLWAVRFKSTKIMNWTKFQITNPPPPPPPGLGVDGQLGGDHQDWGDVQVRELCSLKICSVFNSKLCLGITFLVFNQQQRFYTFWNGMAIENMNLCFDTKFGKQYLHLWKPILIFVFSGTAIFSQEVVQHQFVVLNK